MVSLDGNSSLEKLGIRCQQLQLHHCADLIFASEQRLRNLANATRSLKPEPDNLPGREETLSHNYLGTCFFDGTQYDLVGGLSDIGTEYALYQRLTECGKHMSCHNSQTKCCHPNDWGISAKPPAIYAARFEESSPWTPRDTRTRTLTQALEPPKTPEVAVP